MIKQQTIDITDKQFDKLLNEYGRGTIGVRITKIDEEHGYLLYLKKVEDGYAWTRPTVKQLANINKDRIRKGGKAFI